MVSLKGNCSVCGKEFTVVTLNKYGGSCFRCTNSSQKDKIVKRVCNLKRLCSSENCSQCLSRSFASHPKSQYWSPKNNKTPREAFRRSHVKYIFDCPCGHSFEASLSNVAHNTNETWCPYCIRNKLCDDFSCKLCFENSFASHERSRFWSPKNSLHPRQVFGGTLKKFLFVCQFGHEFEAMLNNATRYIQWCPFCVHKTETKLFEYLTEEYSELELIRQAFFPWCVNPKTRKKLPFDFCFPSLNLIIELDGAQHFRQVANWNPPEETLKRDVDKMKFALENGFSVVRLLQEDVLFEKGGWKSKLSQAIQKNSSPICEFLSEGEEYLTHQQMMNSSQK